MEKQAKEMANKVNYWNISGILAFIGCSLELCLTGACIGQVAILLPSIRDALGTGAMGVSTLMLCIPAVGAIAGVFGVKLLRAVRAKWCMLFGSLMAGLYLWSISSLSYAGTNMVFFVGCGIFAGLSAGIGSMAAVGALCEEFFGEQAGRVFGMCLCVQFFGGTFLSWSAGQLLLVMDFRELLNLYGNIFCFGGIALNLVFIHKPTEDVQRAVNELKTQKALQDAQKKAEDADSKLAGLTVSQALRTPCLYVFLVAELAGAVVLGCFSQYNSLFLSSFGMSGTQIANYVAIYTFFMGVHAFWTGFFEAKYGPRAFIVVVYAGILIGIGLLYGWAYSQVALMAVVGMAFVGFVKPITSTPANLLPHLFGRKDYPSLHSLALAIYYVGICLNSLTTAYVLDTLGGSYALIYAGIMACISFVLFMIAIPMAPMQKILKRARLASLNAEGN